MNMLPLKCEKMKPGVVVHACIPSTQWVEERGLGIPAASATIVRLCFGKQIKQREKMYTIQ
jgi:hypothetical protein